jgi:hypothetical protein
MFQYFEVPIGGSDFLCCLLMLCPEVSEVRFFEGVCSVAARSRVSCFRFHAFGCTSLEGSTRAWAAGVGGAAGIGVEKAGVAGVPPYSSRRPRCEEFVSEEFVFAASK